MKSINVKLGIVSLGLLVNFSCKKENALKSFPESEPVSASNVEANSKIYFGVSNPLFDFTQKYEDNYLNYDLSNLKKENNYFTFADYTVFFKALKKINTLSENEYNEITNKIDFKCRKIDYNAVSLINKNQINGNITIPFQSYFRLLNKQGIVKIGNELHLYKSKSLVIIKNGNVELISDALALSDNPINNKNISVSATFNYNPDFTNNLVFGVVDGNHISSLGSQGSAVQVTSPLPGVADALNYDFHINAVSMAPVNVANFPCDIALSYFRCILKYTNYQGTQLSIASIPYTQGGLYHTDNTIPTMWSVSGNVGQALIPVGATFTGSYCSQVGYYEKYSTVGYIGTGGTYQLKCVLNSCKPF